MKVLIQRVTHAHVEVDSKIVGTIENGVLVFIGITHSDTTTQAVWLANKLINLRLFEDSSGKINQSLIDCKGSALIISQFTLYADCSDGRRPSFTQAAAPEIAKPLYEQFVDAVRKGGIPVETGIFGADMKVSLLNDGPVTLLVER
ncbi:MAG: D-tyrosyl-tRNA(Tyr) deacylase [Simkania sp.]|nr:D-tyrosyl-tRNA(Tyr) deacylase [Simkania sp.]